MNFHKTKKPKNLINNFKVFLNENFEEKLKKIIPDLNEYRILKKSFDARNSKYPHFIYKIEYSIKNKKLPPKELLPINKINFKWDNNSPLPIIAGSGPSGLFCALRFAEKGIPCIILERGSSANIRLKKINSFFRKGILDSDNNIYFGEGGAGFFSDGKLTTRIKSPYIPYILDRLIKFGAPKQIEYISNPHIGSNFLRKIIIAIRNYLLQNNCQILFDHKLVDFIFEKNKLIGIKTNNEKSFFTNKLILATGQADHNIYYLLKKYQVAIQGKSFAVGIRIEHPKEFINKVQYGNFYNNPQIKKELRNATYRLSFHNHNTNQGVYSFCMCPGGYILPSTSSNESVVSNGMSNYHQNSCFSNSAIIVSIDYKKYFSASNALEGLSFIKKLEKQAKQMILHNKGQNQLLPGQNLIDFLYKRKTISLNKNSVIGGSIPARLDQLFPNFIYEPLVEGLEKFNDKIPGFINKDVQIFGVETRSSSPVFILRNKETLESISHEGLFPIGEGSGYAGGIMSAACDGIKIAEMLVYH